MKWVLEYVYFCVKSNLHSLGIFANSIEDRIDEVTR